MKFLALLSVATIVGNYAVSASPVRRGNDGHDNGKTGGDRGGGSGRGGKGDHGKPGLDDDTCATPVNELHQYSVIAALTEGVAAGGTLIKNVLTHGDLGLGTFGSLVGEMIVVDGVVYHAFANKSVVVADPETVQTPFAAVTRFQAEEETRASISNFSDFTAQLPTWFGNTSVTNHFVSYRLDGTFTLRIRAPGGQEYPLESLANVTARQTEWEYENLEGTMVGFRGPQYAANINAAGDHLHFITTDRSIGGHVLEFNSVGEVDVKLAKMTTYTVEVPSGGEFDQVTMA